MASKALKALPIAVIALIAAYGAYYYFLREKPLPGYMETTGVIEAAETELSSKIAGRIEWLCCREGDMVDAGAVAVRLDSTELQARLLEGQASRAAADQAVTEAAIAREDALSAREAAESTVEAARAEATRANALFDEASENFERAKRLFEDGYIAKRDFDSARAAFESNRALLDSNRARARSLEANLRSASVAIRAAEARIASAKARSAQAAAQVKVLESQLEETVITAPMTGVVSYQSFERGEYVTPGAAIYNIHSAADIWARVDIEETRIQEVSIGSRATITPSGGGREFEGTVSEVGELGGFATQRDVTRGRSDIKTFRVKARVKDPEGLLKPGMTVDVKIYPAKGPDAGDRDR